MQSPVTSQLDYCNSSLFGISQSLTNRLQRTQNCAASLVFRTHRRNHISPVLYELHWLPVRFRSQFKILLLTFKAFNQLTPSYITSEIVPYIPARSLRSMNRNLLTVPLTRSSTYELKRFHYTAATILNNFFQDILTLI